MHLARKGVSNAKATGHAMAHVKWGASRAVWVEWRGRGRGDVSPPDRTRR